MEGRLTHAAQEAVHASRSRTRPVADVAVNPHRVSSLPRSRVLISKPI